MELHDHGYSPLGLFHLKHREHMIECFTPLGPAVNAQVLPGAGPQTGTPLPDQGELRPCTRHPMGAMLVIEGLVRGPVPPPPPRRGTERFHECMNDEFTPCAGLA